MSQATGTPAVPALVDASNRISLRDPVFISDLHLCARRPATLQRFFDLVEELAGNAAELLILGDLFEYWAGDDTLQGDGADDLLAQEVAAALLRLSARNTSCFLMHGNRDLLLGAQFLERSGAYLLADPAIALLGGEPVLLAHGDAYCTRDLPYQAFRRQARNAPFQAAFLTRPLAERRAVIGQARSASEADKQAKDEQIMDVTAEAIEQALREAGVLQMIHGHTHRPARHEFAVDGHTAVRWVLPDWDLDASPGRGGGLRVADGRLVPFALQA
jgi:UDP-2,3-diacylglucosamine hydrolase